MPFVTTKRLKHFYLTHGNDNGLVLVLLHGSFGSSRWWEPFVSILPESIFAVAPDLRGCGQSDRRAGGYDIAEQAEDVHAFLQGLNLRNIDLIAHSSSAAIAVEFALTHQQLLNSLILVDPVPVEGVFTPLEGYRLLESMRDDRELLSHAIAAMMCTFDHADRADNQPNHHFFERLVDDAMQMAPAAFTATARALERWNRFGDTSTLTLPCLILWGDQDEIVSRDAMTRSLIAIPGANNLEVLRGVGHSPMIEAPLALAERIVEFL